MVTDIAEGFLGEMKKGVLGEDRQFKDADELDHFLGAWYHCNLPTGVLALTGILDYGRLLEGRCIWEVAQNNGLIKIKTDNSTPTPFSSNLSKETNSVGTEEKGKIKGIKNLANFDADIESNGQKTDKKLTPTKKSEPNNRTPSKNKLLLGIPKDWKEKMSPVFFSPNQPSLSNPLQQHQQPSPGANDLFKSRAEMLGVKKEVNDKDYGNTRSSSVDNYLFSKSEKGEGDKLVEEDKDEGEEKEKNKGEEEGEEEEDFLEKPSESRQGNPEFIG